MTISICSIALLSGPVNWGKRWVCRCRRRQQQALGDMGAWEQSFCFLSDGTDLSTLQQSPLCECCLSESPALTCCWIWLDTAAIWQWISFCIMASERAFNNKSLNRHQLFWYSIYCYLWYTFGKLNFLGQVWCSWFVIRIKENVLIWQIWNK